MLISTLTENNFDAVTSKDGIVMIDFWADWCGACQSFNPIYEKVAKKYSNHTFTKLDTVAEKQLVSNLGVEHIPTLMLYRDGILLFQQPGYYEEEKLMICVDESKNPQND